MGFDASVGDTSVAEDVLAPDMHAPDAPADTSVAETSVPDAGLDASPGAGPTSCAAILAATPAAADGDYTLYVGGDLAKPWTAYCSGMQPGDAGDGGPATPLEYLTLGAGLQNFSEYKAGGSSPGTNVVTTYSRVRIDPATLVVQCSDQRFAVSSGSLTHCSSTVVVTSMPFAVAMSCDSMVDAPASIDLTGTPFTIPPNDFAIDSFPTEQGTITYVTDTNVTLVGGGFAGWTQAAPVVAPPYNQADVTLSLIYGPYPDGGFLEAGAPNDAGDAGDAGD